MTRQELLNLRAQINNLRAYITWDEQGRVDDVEKQFDQLMRYVSKLEQDVAWYEYKFQFHPAFQRGSI